MLPNEVQGVRHEEAVEIGGKGDGDEVAADGDEGDSVDRFAVQCGTEIDAVDGAAFRQKTGEGFGEEAGAAAEVGPALLTGGDEMAKLRMVEEVDGFG